MKIVYRWMLLISLLIISSLGFLYLLHLASLDDVNVQKGKLNWKNIEQIEIGMHESEVNRIMSEPDTVYVINNRKFPNYRKKVYSYYKGSGIYGYLQVIMDPDVDTVLEVRKNRE